MVTASLAVNAGRPDVGEETMWVSLVAFGRATEPLLRHVRGDLLAAMGPLHRTKYTGRDGVEREGWSLTINALMSARTVRPPGGRKRAEAQRPSAAVSGGADAEFNDEIPF